MWNLSALADKAKEAAARIEAQLDESTGIEGGGGGSSDNIGGGIFGVSKDNSTAINGSSQLNDDLNDDDDFFSDTPAVSLPSTHAGNVGSWEQTPQKEDNDTSYEQPTATTKLDIITAKEGDDDFFGDEQPTQQFQSPPQKQVSEEIDFGGDNENKMRGEDGWDEEVDNINLDDDNEENNEISPVAEEQQYIEEEPQQEETAVVEKPEEEEHAVKPELKPEPEAEELFVEEPSVVLDHSNNIEEHEAEVSPEDAQNDPAPEPSYKDVEEETENDLVDEPSVDQINETQESIYAHEETNTIAQEDDNMLLPEVTPPTDAHTSSAPPSMNDAETQQYLAPTDAQTSSAPPMNDAETQQYLATIAQLESQLYQREEQLASKSDQITSLTMQYESENTQLRQVISETKEEAKKRIVRAKDRVEEMQTKLTDAVRRADSAGGSSQEQSDVITALRAEGEQLARKQSAMEQSVRSAKGEARELHEKLDIEMDARQQEEAKVKSLEGEVKSLKEDLASARKGETLSKKLEGELVAAKEESEKQRASNLLLDQQFKELKKEKNTLKKEVEESRAGAALELEGESNKLRRERDDMLGDLESKLRTSDREANVREDALRHEVSELRKRWQDAVRRAEDLSMDVQHSTAPLLRQLESIERQNRARATAWAELETKLRSDLEENIIQLEKLTKERNDLVASDKRSQRLVKEKEQDIVASQETIDELSATIETLETKVEELEEEGKNTKQQLVIAERKAAEGASKVRNDMLQTIVDSEERYQTRIEALDDELDVEKQQRGALEKQLDDLAESVAAAEFAQEHVKAGQVTSPAEQKKLRPATDQTSILHDTLVGFDSDVDDDEDDERDENGTSELRCAGSSSFAAMEQLAQGLKGAKKELETLRKELASSEETRASLGEELGGARQAVEKLPLFEQKVTDLTMEVKLKEDEIRTLQDDIADVRFLYRTQLDTLLEEKAATPTPSRHNSVPLSSSSWDDFDEEEKQQASSPIIADDSN